MTRSSRLLDLLQLLRGYRQPVTAKALAKALEISPRTLYRDIASLMAMGAPVRGEAGVGYVLDSGFFLWPAIPTVIACGLSRRLADVIRRTAFTQHTPIASCVDGSLRSSRVYACRAG
ncbi:helix-turn-helix transcriptional regulator [Asaia spathodeae]|uniref:HTH domain-containing protein n=1 Tax=Asaia spathodeae TaxID=657016 RepID=A0ABX2P278_9PROT|nr:HTH domain-containing protein [Asaia spathodeae]